ncbi:MAG: FecR family protein [Planctomycetota bacterium]|nr:FecR family protein [Planctomycetota bacterium]
MSHIDSTPPDPLLERLRTAGALGEGEQDASPSEGVAPTPAAQAAAAEIRQLGVAVAAATKVAEPHLTLGELEALVKARQADAMGPNPGSWEMPLHVSACPLCLEGFEVLLEGVQQPDSIVINRFIAASEEASAPAPIPFPRKPRFSTAWKLGIAAAAVLAAGVTWLAIQPYLGGSHIDTGAVTISPSGSNLAKNETIPQGTVIEAREETTAALPDGSRLTIDPQSRLAVQRSLSGDMTIDLQYGRITAAVTHQKSGHSFRVLTPLGQVTVVGTKFTVTSRNESVTVFENGGAVKEPQKSQAKVQAVVVEVLEGMVLVKNTRGEMLVGAGKKAVLRDEPPSIELLEK